MTRDRSVLDEVVAAVEAVHPDTLHAARSRLSSRLRHARLGRLEHLAARISAMRRVPLPPVHQRVLVVCAADRSKGPIPSEAYLVLRDLVDGRAPLSALARAAGARVVLVDSGVRGLAEEQWPGVLRLRDGDATMGALEGSVDQAVVSVQTGIALALSLASEGLDLLGLGEVSTDRVAPSEAIIAALLEGDDPLSVLATHGAFDLGTMAGLCLCCAAIRVPVVLDGVASVAAALLATRLAPAAKDYLIAAHPLSRRAHAQALAALDLVPLFDLGLVGGDGCGAAIALGLADSAHRLLAEGPG